MGSVNGIGDRPDHVVFIINSAHPYLFDINQILALPDGFRYRNRFDLRWVQTELHGSIPSLCGRHVLLVLRDMHDARLVPVRWGRISEARTVGHIAYFEYMLEDMIKYGTDEAVRATEVAAYTTRAKKLHSWLPGLPGQPLSEASVFLSSFGEGMPSASSSALDAWGDTVSAVASAPAFQGIEFLRIVALRDQHGVDASVATGGFLVRPEAEYSLQVFQYMPSPGAVVVRPHAISCRAFQQNIVLLRDAQQAVGKYDMLSFPLRVGDLIPGSTTSLEIPHIPDAATTAVGDASLFIPLITAKASRTMAILSLLIAVAAAFVSVFPPSSGVGDAGQETIRSIAMVIFVLTVSGPARTLQSFWPTVPFGGGK